MESKLNFKVGDIVVRRHFFLDPKTDAPKIGAFMSELKNLKKDAEWVLLNESENAEKGIRKANETYSKRRTTNHVGKIKIDLTEEKEQSCCQITRSITWEVNITRHPLVYVNLEGAISVMRKRGLKYETLFGGFIRKNLLEKLDAHMVLNSVVFDIYGINIDFKNLVSSFKDDSELPDFLGVPRGQSSVSYVDGDKLIVMTYTKYHHIPYWFLVFHRDKSVPKKEDDHMCIEEKDYVYNILQLIVCRVLFEREEDAIGSLEKKLYEKSKLVYGIIKDVVGSQEPVDSQLKEALYSILDFRQELMETKTNVTAIVKHREATIEKLSTSREIEILESVYNKAIYGISDIENELSSMIENIDDDITALRQTIDEVTQSKTLTEIKKSVEVEERMGELLKLSHAVDAVSLILTFIFFSELFIHMIEMVNGDFENFPPLIKLSYWFLGVFLGISSSIIISRWVIHTNLADKILYRK